MRKPRRMRVGPRRRLVNCRGSRADRSDAVLRKCPRGTTRLGQPSDVRVRPARGAGGQPTFSRSALVRRLTFQSPRAICSARTMQVSLGGRPHRSDRSQSPQVKSDTRRIVAILLATLAKMPALMLLMGPSCVFRWDLGMYRSEPLPCCGAFLDPCGKFTHEDTWCALT